METELNLTPRQSEAYKKLIDEETRYILYGGARGGGKSFLLCYWAWLLCHHLCSLFSLRPSSQPLVLGFLGRKQGIDFKKTTLETWKRFIHPSTYEIKKQDGEIILFNGTCKLFYGGLDNQDTINKFNSSELAFFGIDQAEETTRSDVAALRGSIRLTHKGIQPNYKELYTANPSDCWLKEDFVDRKQDGYVYVPALPSDNPHLPTTYIETLEQAFKHSPALLKAYRDGDWHALKSSNTLLSLDDLDKLKHITIHFPNEKRVIACDPATSHDECVIYYMKDYRIEDQMIFVGESDTMKIAGHIATMANRYNVKDVGGDVIGLGAGIFDRLNELGKFQVHTINSAMKANDDRFLNLRALMYWNLMEKVLDKQIHYPEDEQLRRQLINITYEVVDSSGKIKITVKDKIKEILGSSPDRADCFAYAVYMSDSAQPYQILQKRYKFEDDSDYPFNPNTV